MPAATAARTGAAQLCPDPTRRARTRQKRAFLELDAVLTTPRRARVWTRKTLRRWQLASLADDAEAIIGELAANAVYASASLGQPVIRFALAFNYRELAILVSDGNPALPRPWHPAKDAESGRGLLMVEALSDRYGWYPLEGGTARKAVWAVLRARRMYPAAASPLASHPQAPAGPGDEQPGHRRSPLVLAGHAGQTLKKATRPVQQPVAGPRPLRHATAEAPGEDVNDCAPSPSVPPVWPTADEPAGIR